MTMRVRGKSKLLAHRLMCAIFDDIAQLVERQAVNLLVVGSSPSIVAILNRKENDR